VEAERGMTAEEATTRDALHIESLESEEDEPWSRHDTWQIPVFLKNGPTMYLQVQTTTVAPQIVGTLSGKVALLLPTVGADGAESLPVLDFGELPVGQDRVVAITITNPSERGTNLSNEALDPFGAFMVLKCPTFIPADSLQTVSLVFRPKKEAAFKEKFVLSAENGNRLRFLCVGHGVSPAFSMQGLEVDAQDRIDVGDVLAGSQIDLPFTLFNKSPFEVNYSVDITKLGETNFSALAHLDVVPAEATVGAESEQGGTLTFAPDVESLSYAAILKIIVPNQKEKMEWRVVGRCWRQAIFLYDCSQAAQAAPLNVHRFKDQLGADQPPPAIALEHTFPQGQAEQQEAAEHQLMLGNCGDKGAGELVFENLAEAGKLGFTLEPPGGKVDAGQKVPITVKYTPPAGGALSMWNQVTLKGSLKGGDPAPAGGAVSVALRLKGFVPRQEDA